MNQADDESAAQSEQFQVSVLEEIGEENEVETVNNRTNGKRGDLECANRGVQDEASPTLGSASMGYLEEELLGNAQLAYSPM